MAKKYIGKGGTPQSRYRKDVEEYKRREKAAMEALAKAKKSMKVVEKKEPTTKKKPKESPWYKKLFKRKKKTLKSEYKSYGTKLVEEQLAKGKVSSKEAPSDVERRKRKKNK